MNKKTEYEKDLNELKEQILKESDTLLTKRDLLERFCEIDKEYNGRPWNLLQILANINILIGQQPCEDTISRADAIRVASGYCHQSNIAEELAKLQPVTPKPKTGHWILDETDNRLTCDKCGCLIYTDDISNGDACYCPNCGTKML